MIDCKVEVTEMMGAETYLYLNFLGNNLTARVDPKLPPAPAAKIRITIDPEKVHVFDKETERTLCN